MIYCCVRAAYVLLKLTLVNDREYVLNNRIATGAVFSRLQLWERHSKPSGCEPSGGSWSRVSGYVCGHAWCSLDIFKEMQLDTNHLKSS